MSKIKIITDSASDIPKDKEKELDIRILNFPITIDGQGYREREDFTTEEFYDILLNCNEIPTSAQITQIEFLEVFEQYYHEEYTDLIYVSICGIGSNTLNSATMAKAEFFEEHPEAVDKMNIHLVDSKIYTIVYGYAVMEAGIKASKGSTPQEIVAYLEDWCNNVQVFFAPYSLEFVKKSGRISAAAAFVGELMGLRPIITFVDGQSKIVEKVRGDKSIIPALIKHASNAMVPQTPHMIITGCLPDKATELSKEFEKKVGYPGVGIFQIGAAIAINAGPKIIGVIVKGKRTN